MLKKKTIFAVLCIIYFILLIPFLHAESRTLVFLPFSNDGNYRYDKFRTHIPNFLFEAVNGLEKINAVSYADVREYMVNNNLKEDELILDTVRNKLADEFNADYLVHGYYFDKGNKISVMFEIYEHMYNGLELNRDHEDIVLENPDTITVNASFNRLLRVIEKIIGGKLELGQWTLTATETCKLSIDGEDIGETPVLLAMQPGSHTVDIIHEGTERDELLLHDVISIKKNNSKTTHQQVFVPFTFNAGKECTVYIDGTEQGPTPFSCNLYWGRKYHIQAVYYTDEGTEKVIYDKMVDTHKPFIVDYESAKAEFTIDFPDNFTAIVGDNTEQILPNTFNIIPGTYKLRVLLDDPEWDRQWLYVKEDISFSPFDQVTLDYTTMVYEKKWALLLFPPALQFHNRQRVKGGVVLAGYLGSAIAAGISGGLWWYYYNQINDGNSYLYNPHTRAFWAKAGTFSSILSFSVFHLYASVDGIVIMNHLYSITSAERVHF